MSSFLSIYSGLIKGNLTETLVCVCCYFLCENRIIIIFPDGRFCFILNPADFKLHMVCAKVLYFLLSNLFQQITEQVVKYSAIRSFAVTFPLASDVQ